MTALWCCLLPFSEPECCVISRRRKSWTDSAKAQGTVTCKLAGVSKKKFKKYFKVAAKTGKITVKKGLKRGAYRVKVKVAAAGNANYEPAAKIAAVKVKVKVKVK